MRKGLVLLCLAYVLSQFFRAFLAVLTQLLQDDICATADDLAFASGMLFLSFAAMQIPVGEALDRVGPRLTAAVLLGVEQPWEVCLMKLMMELVEKSAPAHMKEMQQRNLIPNPNRASLEIDAEFEAAAKDRSRIPYLQKRLRELGVFDQLQDRFFQLVRELS